MKTSEPIVIAIDGPSASGKSTVARGVAKSLGFIYVDTGAMYRTVAWLAVQKRMALNDDAAIMALMEAAKVEFLLRDGSVQMWVDGYYPQKEIRTADVSAAVPEVAKLRKLRAWVVGHQRAMTQFGNLVMEGRDIGSVVFPDSPHKFYLDADPDVRAQRRTRDLEAMKIKASKEGVAQAIQQRDKKDSSRNTSPLQIALGATVIDNSRRSADETAKLIVARVRGRA